MGNGVSGFSVVLWGDCCGTDIQELCGKECAILGDSVCRCVCVVGLTMFSVIQTQM